MTDTTTTTHGTDAVQADQLADGYIAMWNETDPDRRRALIERTWTGGGSYVDPLFTASGADELDAMVAGVHQQYPGHRFRLLGTVDAHHDRARWGWELGVDGEPPLVRGVDFAVIDPDGRFASVTGFFEPPTA